MTPHPVEYEAIARDPLSGPKGAAPENAAISWKVSVTEFLPKRTAGFDYHKVMGPRFRRPFECARPHNKYEKQTELLSVFRYEYNGHIFAWVARIHTKSDPHVGCVNSVEYIAYVDEDGDGKFETATQLLPGTNVDVPTWAR